MEIGPAQGPKIERRIEIVNRQQTQSERLIWYFDVSGGFTSHRPGLKRTDTLWKAIGKAAVVHEVKRNARLVLLTTDAPSPGSAGARALDEVVGDKKPIRDVIEMLNADHQQRLRRYAATKRVSATR